MQEFLQQLINGLSVGSIYALIAIGYTMVYGVLQLINFAHGDVFMVGAMVALYTATGRVPPAFPWWFHAIVIGALAAAWLVLFLLGRPTRQILRDLLPLAAIYFLTVPTLLLVSFVARRLALPSWSGTIFVLAVSVVVCGLLGYLIERLAYRPLRESFRLAPLISAIGMSIFLQNYVQITQGARVKPLQPVIVGTIPLTSGGGFDVQVSYLQLIIVLLTVALMAGFTYVIGATPLGRAQRACEQDRTMALLLGVNVDRTISLTFVMGAALAAVAGMMVLLYYGVIDFFIGFLAGIKAFTAAVLGGIGSLPGAMLGGILIGLIEAFWSGYFSVEYKDVAVFVILVLVLIFRPTGLLGRPEVEKV
jgi:branched-chain amino acid transport system permease protein